LNIFEWILADLKKVRNFFIIPLFLRIN
jgi:hypothetical protein